jgi:hypothetical protein
MHILVANRHNKAICDLHFQNLLSWITYGLVARSMRHPGRFVRDLSATTVNVVSRRGFDADLLPKHERSIARGREKEAAA